MPPSLQRALPWLLGLLAPALGLAGCDRLSVSVSKPAYEIVGRSPLPRTGERGTILAACPYVVNVTAPDPTNVLNVTVNDKPMKDVPQPYTFQVTGPTAVSASAHSAGGLLSVALEWRFDCAPAT
jgi:hypothetical protein